MSRLTYTVSSDAINTCTQEQITTRKEREGRGGRKGGEGGEWREDIKMRGGAREGRGVARREG